VEALEEYLNLHSNADYPLEAILTNDHTLILVIDKSKMQ